MGCWNKTCGISNLHIIAGDPVYVFVIEQNPHHDRCYSTAFWRPVMLPFTSVYDDYGGGENSDQNLDIILAALKERVVEMDVGENQYHDIAVSADNLDHELFFNAVHKGRLKVGNRWAGSGESQVDFVMMRKDIVDNICNNWLREMYVGNGKGTGGYGNNYIYYDFADVLSKIPEFLDRVEKEFFSAEEPENPNNVLPAAMRSWHAIRGLSDLYSYEERNLVAIYLSCINDHKYSSILRVNEAIVDAVERKDRVEATRLLTDVLRGAFIDSFMEHTRRNWMPGGHEGSQSQESDAYRLLCSAINTALDVEKAKYDDENYDGDEELDDDE